MRIWWAVAILLLQVALGERALAQDDIGPFVGTWAVDCSAPDQMKIVAGGGTPMAALAIDGRPVTGPVEGFGDEKGIVVRDGDTERLFYVLLNGDKLNLSYFSGRDRLAEVTVAGARLQAGGEAAPLQRCEETAAMPPPDEGPVVKTDKYTLRVLTAEQLIGSWGHSPEYASGRSFTVYGCPGWNGKETYETDEIGTTVTLTSPDGATVVANGWLTFYRDAAGGISAYRRYLTGSFPEPVALTNITPVNANEIAFRFDDVDYTLKRTKVLKWNWTAAGEKVETFNLAVVETPFFLYDLSYKYEGELNTRHDGLLKCLP